MKSSELFSNGSVYFYYFLVSILYTIYIVTFLGIYYVNPEYSKYLSIFIRLFISIFLLIRFNPFSKLVINTNDSILISASAFFLLINTGVTEYLYNYVNNKIENGI